jgi:hypothetical protein
MSRRAICQLVISNVENPVVLSTLAGLSGVNISFDQAAWRRWLASEAKTHPVDVRRDL